MSQYAYILILISLVVIFLINKYEKLKIEQHHQEHRLRDAAFKTDIRERIQTTENINDVIAYINKGYRLGLILSKEITDQLK